MKMRLLLGLVLVLLPISVVAEEERRETLRYDIPVGFSYSFQELSAMESALTISGGGQQMPVQRLTQSTIRGEARVLASEGGKPTQLELRFDPASASQITVNGQPQQSPFALAGQTIKVRISNDEIVEVQSADGWSMPLDPSTRSAVEPFVLFHDAVLPGRRVGVGDAWPATISTSGGNMKNDLTYAVSDFSMASGVPVADLDWRGTVTSTMPGSQMQGDVAGTARIDLKTGIALEAGGAGKVRINGEMSEAGQTYRITGQGDIALQRWFAYGRTQLPAISMPSPVQSQPAWPQQPQQPQPAAEPAWPQSAPQSQQRGGGDPRLVGVFKGESVYYNHGVGTNTQLYWVFDGAGGVYYGAQTHWMASARDYNLDLVWTAGGVTDPNADRGTWQADGTFLTIQWEDGNTGRFAYGFEPNGALVFRNPQTRKLINFYDRVR